MKILDGIFKKVYNNILKNKAKQDIKDLSPSTKNVVDLENDSLEITLKLIEEPFKNWFVNILIEDIVDDKISFAYTVEHVPQHVTDEEVENSSDYLKSYLSNHVLEILEKASAK